MIRRIVLALVILGVMGAGGYWVTMRVLEATAAPTGGETPTTRVKRGTVAITVTARGDLQGGNPEMLTVPMVGSDSLIVTDLRYMGEPVKEGDVIAEFDTTQQEYNLKEAEADLAEAQQKVIQAEADNIASDAEARQAVETARTNLKVAELQVKRNQFLSATKARDNEIALEQAQNKVKQTEQDLNNRKTTSTASLNIQKAGEMKAKTMADIARKNIENMTLRSKTGGYVNLMPNLSNVFVLTTGMTLPIVQIGDTVRPGMVIAQIPDLENWEVSAKIPEVDRGHLAPGQLVSVAVVALGGKSFPARITTLGNATGQAWDRRFDCRMKLEQGGPELRPGMSSQLVITASKLDNVLWLPSQALFERDGKSYVFLRTENGFSPRDVTLVNRSESQVIITGASEGDEVALANPSDQKKPTNDKQSAIKAISK